MGTSATLTASFRAGTASVELTTSAAPTGGEVIRSRSTRQNPDSVNTGRLLVTIDLHSLVAHQELKTLTIRPAELDTLIGSAWGRKRTVRSLYRCRATRSRFSRRIEKCAVFRNFPPGDTTSRLPSVISGFRRENSGGTHTM